MESPRRWAILYFLIYLSIQTAKVLCQNVPFEGGAQIQNRDMKRDVARTINPSSRTLTYTTEVPYVSNVQDDRLKTVNVMSSPSYYSQEPMLFNSQQVMPSNLQNMAPSPTSSTFSPQYTMPQQASLIPEPINSNGFNRIAQAIPVENYAGMVQPVSTYWQIPSNDAYSYPAGSPVMFTEASPPPVNLQISPPSSNLPIINTQSGIVEFLSDSNLGTIGQDPISLSNRYEDGYPLNLQINVPSQNVPGPRITVVSTLPNPVTSVNSDLASPFPPFGFPPPIVKRKSRSSLRKLLPLLLIALLSDQNCGGNNCCSCNCNCNSDNPIPIPYPIPIPVNNPMINNVCSSYSSRKREYRDYEDDEDNN